MKTYLSFALSVLASLATSLAAAGDSAVFTALCRYESGSDISPLRQYEQLIAQAGGSAAARKSVEADLARVLTADSTFEAKRFACTQLAVIGGEASVPALAGLLKSEDTVGIACLALAKHPSAKASDALLGGLDVLQGRTLIQVVNTLGTRGEPRAVKPLTRLAEGSDREVAGSAAVALGHIGNAAARKALTNLRKHPDAAMNPALNEASLLLAARLAGAGDVGPARKLYEELLQTGHPEHVRRGAFEALARLDRDGGQERVAGVLAGSDADLKPSAIAAVGALEGAGVSARFAAQLATLAPGEQALLVQALAVRNDASARETIQKQLESPNAEVRIAAALALGRVGDVSAVPALARALAAAQGMDELKAIEGALVSLPGGDLVDRALMMQVANRTAGRKAPLLSALVRRANPVALRLFIAEAGSADAAMAKLAFQGLSRVATPQDVSALLQALAGLKAPSVRDEAEASIGQVLNRVGDASRNSAAVREAMGQASSVEARCSLLRLLSQCPDAAALSAVTAALGDADVQVKAAARRTLADWPDAHAWSALEEVYGQAGDEAERMVALRGLVRLLGEQNAAPNAQVVGRYRGLLAGAKSDDDRRLILGTLAGCVGPEALALAVDQLGNAGVKAEAELAVKKLAEAIKEKHPQAAQAALEKVK